MSNSPLLRLPELVRHQHFSTVVTSFRIDLNSRIWCLVLILFSMEKSPSLRVYIGNWCCETLNENRGREKEKGPILCAAVTYPLCVDTLASTWLYRLGRGRGETFKVYQAIRSLKEITRRQMTKPGILNWSSFVGWSYEYWQPNLYFFFIQNTTSESLKYVYEIRYISCLYKSGRWRDDISASAPSAIQLAAVA